MKDEKTYEEQYKLGEKYFIEGNYENAYNKFMELDKLNVEYSMNARYRLGQMYYFGNYVKRDYEKAFYYFSNTTNPEAKLFLGKMYYYRQGVNKSYQKAFECFEQISGFNQEAYYMIGIMYSYGDYVEKDIEKARKIFNELLEKYQYQKAKKMLEMLKSIEDGTFHRITY